MAMLSPRTTKLAKISTRRNVRRAAAAWEASTASVSTAPSTRRGPFSTTVVDRTPGVSSSPKTWPLTSSRRTCTAFVSTRLTMACGPTPARASCRASWARPDRTASRLRFD